MAQKVFIRFGKIGWVIQEFEFEYEVNSQTMKVSEAIVEKAILSLSEIQAVKCVLESLRSPQNEPWWNVFDMKSTGPSKHGNFQVIPCHRLLGSGGDGFGIVLFHSNSQRGALAMVSVQFHRCTPFKATQVATLNEVREAVVNKLGDNASTFIGELQI